MPELPAAPAVPALNLDAAAADASAALDKKKSFGKKIASSFKKAMTPRTGSASNLDAVAAAAENGAAQAGATASAAASAVKTEATDAVASVQTAVSNPASRLGQKVETAKTEVVAAAKEATGGNDKKGPALLAVGALVAVLAVVLTAVAGNKKPEPVAPPKKKGFF